MKTSIKELLDSKHGLEYLSLKALKMFGAGIKINIPKVEFGVEFKAGIGAEVKTQLEIGAINKYRSAMIREIKKRKAQIINFNEWSKAPINDALVLIRLSQCSCFETMETEDPETGDATVVFYAGYSQEEHHNFIGMIGIREFTGPYLIDPSRVYTKNTGNEAFYALFGKDSGKPSRHDLFREVAIKLQASDWVGTQTFNSIALVNIIDFDLNEPRPWTMANIVYMVRDKYRY